MKHSIRSQRVTSTYLSSVSRSMPKKATPYTIATLALLATVTLFRLFYCTHLELVGDEAYYWLWSRHLDYCYLDKGPTIAWLIAGSQAIFGPTVFAIRLVAVMLGTGTGLAIFLLGCTLFNDRIGFWSVIVALVTPLFAVGAILTTIDTAYVFFWSFAALTFWKATKSDALSWWIGTGFLVGLSIWSKYTGAIQLVSFALFCIWERKGLLERPGLWIMAGVACLFLVPPLIWNWQHGWPTSSFLVHRGALDQQAHPRTLNVLAFLVQQAGVISPLIFLGILTSICFPRLARTPRTESNYFLALFLPLFVLYLLLSFQHTAQANWTAAAYIGGILFLVVKFEQLANRRSSVRW
ncbi:MAG: glycosyltransferase family 39 protein, partial [Verrucomicrobia bacterium]|nr:glycosyltransferase family 39 protein [Verrucomicrobiota bacterium]